MTPWWVTLVGLFAAPVTALVTLLLTHRAEERRIAASQNRDQTLREADAIAGFLSATQAVGMQWGGYLGLLHRASTSAEVRDAEDRSVPGINQAMIDLTSALARVETSVKSAGLVALASEVETAGQDIVMAMDRFILSQTQQDFDWVVERWNQFNVRRREFVDSARLAVFPTEEPVRRTTHKFLAGGGVEPHGAHTVHGANPDDASRSSERPGNGD